MQLAMSSTPSSAGHSTPMGAAQVRFAQCNAVCHAAITRPAPPQLVDERKEYGGGMHLHDWEKRAYVPPSVEKAQRAHRRSLFARGKVSTTQSPAPQPTARSSPSALHDAPETMLANISGGSG